MAWNLTANEYLVVWSGDDDTAPLVNEEFEIFGQRVDAGGTEIGTNDFRLSDMGPDGNVSFDAFSPAVAWNATANEYLVVWAGDDDTAPLVDGGVRDLRPVVQPGYDRRWRRHYRRRFRWQRALQPRE